MRRLTLTLALLIVVACSGDSGSTPTEPMTPVPTSITLSSSSVSLSSLGETSQLTATVEDQRGAAMAGQTVTWSSSDDRVATVSEGGVVMGVADGSATITAASGPLSSTASVTVTQTAAALTISPDSLSFASLTDTATVTGDLTDALGNAMTTGSSDPVAWTTSDTLVATVTAGGLVTAEGNGSATITGASGSLTGSVVVTVSQVPASLTVSPTSMSFNALGATAAVTATVKDAADVSIADPLVSWSSANDSIASVSDGGVVAARANGSTTVTATAGGLATDVSVSVGQVPTTVTLSATTAQFASLGDTATVTASVTDSEGNAIASAGVTWTSSDEGVATVSNGLITAVANGTATITAASGSASAEATVTVAQVPAEITLSPDTLASVVIGESLTIDATVRDSGGSVVAGAVVAWVSSDESVATVDAGLVQALTAGGTQVTASSGDASAYITVNVLGFLQITTTSLSSGVLGSAYSEAFTASGGDGSYTWSLGSGALPAGLGLSPEGLVSGTPTAEGEATATVHVATGDGQTDSVMVSMAVFTPLTIGPSPLADGEVGQAYTDALDLTGGDGAYTVAVVEGGVPVGLVLGADGVLSGTPTTVEAPTFTVEVTSGDGQVVQAVKSVKVLRRATFIEGYAGDVSIDRGASIDLHVSTDGSEHRMEIFRVGWYGGVGRSLVATVDSVAGLEQPPPEPDPVTGLVEAGWASTYTLQSDPGWTSGVYLIDLISDPAPVRQIMFVLRDDANPGDLVVQIPVTTYQAYNNWGGKSLYEFNSDGGQRAYKVSFDRPYETGSGSGDVYAGDYNLIRWLEREGYDATYTTSVDLERDPAVLSGVSAFISNFHDEYWSRAMRDVLTDALDGGTHAAFFDANNIYWQVRFEPSSDGVPNRVMVSYKDATLDGGAPAGQTTVRWRDPEVDDPENGLLGVMYASDYDFGTSFPWVVKNADHWIYDGTGVTEGEEIGGLVGYEYDRVWNNGVAPPYLGATFTILAESPVVDRNGVADVHNATIYERQGSGSIVFAAGTNYWPWLLDSDGYDPGRPDPDPRVQQMTRNLLARMLPGVPQGVAAIEE